MDRASPGAHLGTSDPYFVERLMMEFHFLQELKQYVGSWGVNLDYFADPSMREGIDMAFRRVETALSGRVEAERQTGRMSSQEMIAVYTLSMALVAMLDDKFAVRRFSTSEAERFDRKLESIDTKWVREILLYVAGQVLGMNVRQASAPMEFEVSFVDYLRHATKLNEPRWKLVNRNLRQGFVSLSRPEMRTLVKNALESHVESRLKDIGKIEVPEFLRPYVQRLRAILEARRWKETPVTQRLSPDLWPPCMRLLRQRLLAGEAVSHFGNFAFSAFLTAIGTQPEEIVQMYSQRGDFDERVAKYQVEHIAGLRGSRTKYTTPKCLTMQTHGLCVEAGRYCGGVKSPMTYYRRNKDWKLAQRSGEPPDLLSPQRA